MNEMIERICRAKAAKHYAKRFGKPEADDHVLANVESNWNIFILDVCETVEAMREPSQGVLDCRPPFMKVEDARAMWQTMIDTALSHSP